MCRAASIRAPARSAAQVVDFGQPLGRPIVYELANRFRLERLDPNAPRSRVRRPIVFYVDRAAPEPIRTALLEGAGWWREAFEPGGLYRRLPRRVCCPRASIRSTRATM